VGESSLIRLPGSRQTSDQPHPSRRQPWARISRPSLSFRLAAVVGSVAALLGLGIAVGVGAVPTPLSDTSSAPRAEILAATPTTSQPGASPYHYAIARVPASAAAHHAKASASPSRTPSAKAKHTAKPSASASATASASTSASPSSPSSTPSTAAPTPPPTVTPTATPSTPTSPPATTNPGLVPTPTAEYQTPTGSNELAWSEALLTALGAPWTDANIISMGYWMQNEAGTPPYGIVGANNPINCSEPGYGGWQIQNEGGGYYLWSYPTVADGVAAIAEYLSRPNYSGIVADLKNGVGLSDPSISSEIAVYAGDHYDQIPDAWGESQGVPETP
jgi:hypothetical protein